MKKMMIPIAMLVNMISIVTGQKEEDEGHDQISEEAEEVKESLMSSRDFIVRIYYKSILKSNHVSLQSIITGVVGFWGGVFIMGLSSYSWSRLSGSSSQNKRTRDERIDLPHTMVYFGM